MKVSLEGKRVALVTGAGQGIGRGIAVRLAQEGYSLAVNDIIADAGNVQSGAYEVKATIERGGSVAEVFCADIASAKARETLVDEVFSRFGKIDLLVNNAGVAPKERRDILNASEESFERLISINLQGPYFLTQLVANRMIQWKDEGKIETARIVFITSISAYTSSTARGEYCISKAALSMAAKLYADRLAEYGIPVIEIRPGIIETPMTSVVKDKYDKMISDGLLPIKRWGKPDDIARVVSAFARGDLDYSTGECIEVGGGFGIRRL
ncbi:MAG TPA: 3-ketoacyl-ACP reductase [bacterium]|nr:3-ketoacyl-ACP reductase [bacterium]